MHRNDITVSSRHPSRNKHPVGRRTALRIIASNAQLFLESEIRGGRRTAFQRASARVRLCLESKTRYAGYVSAAAYDFTGMAAAVEVPQAATGAADTILAVVKDSQNFAFIVVEEGMLYFDRCTAGARSISGIPYSATDHRWWRLRHDAATNRIHFETSLNGISWTSQRNDGVSFPISALRMEISAGTGTVVPSTVPAQFDNFSLTRP